MSVEGLFWFGALLVSASAGLALYVPALRAVVRGRVPTAWVSSTNILVAGLLTALLAMLAWRALASTGPRNLELRDIAMSAVLYGSIVILLIGVMVFLDTSPLRAFGLSHCPVLRALPSGALYGLAALPILLVAQFVFRGAAGDDLAPQEIVRFLRDADSWRDRLSVVGMALVVAPLAEEFIFRGYLYGVGKRLFGPVPALVLTSLLFAAIHGHIGSLPALFMLAVCFVAAYEKTGSLLVPIAAHSMFNALQVLLILYGA